MLAGCIPVGQYKGGPEGVSPPAAFAGWEGKAPDVVLMTMTGTCFSQCSNVWGVWDYLREQGTVDTLEAALRLGGSKVRSFSYVSSPLDDHYSNDYKVWARGWTALQTDYALVKRHWPNARVVLLGFSHGVPWMDTLVRLHPNDNFEATIDLEGMCHAWDYSYQASLQARNAPQLLLEACKPLGWPHWPSARFNEVPDNVKLNLEVASYPAIYSKHNRSNKGVNYFWDATPNFRKDGSRRGIESVTSMRDGHQHIDNTDSASVAWLAGRLAELSRGWAKEKNETLKN